MPQNPFFTHKNLFSAAYIEYFYVYSNTKSNGTFFKFIIIANILNNLKVIVLKQTEIIIKLWQWYHFVKTSPLKWFNIYKNIFRIVYFSSYMNFYGQFCFQGFDKNKSFIVQTYIFFGINWVMQCYSLQNKFNFYYI